MLAFMPGVAAHAAGARPMQGRLRSGLFEIEYASSDEALARQSAQILEQSLAEFSEHLPGGDEAIGVVICHTLEQFRQRVGAFGKARVAGVAKSEQSLIIVKAPRLSPPGQDYRGTLRHELIHVLIARNTGLDNVPRWFNEGVAMVVSHELRWSSTFRIARMYTRNRLIPYPELNFAFAPRGNETVFGDAYAQSLSMTRYLIERIGEDAFWDLVHALDTEDFDQALRRHAGLTPGALHDAWRRSLWKVALVASLVSGFTLFQFAALLVVLAYLRKRHHGRQILRQWEEEEAGVPFLTPRDLESDSVYLWEDDEEY